MYFALSCWLQRWGYSAAAHNEMFPVANELTNKLLPFKETRILELSDVN
jgi:hypothetical protein